MELEELPVETTVEWGVEPHPWHGFSFLDKVIAIALPVLAAGVFVLPFLDHAMLRRLARLPGLGGITDWLVNSGGWWLAGLGLLLLWVGFVLFKRWRISGDEHLWVDAGCPQCKERDLVRVSRERRDRWYGLMGIPAYRYACRNCTWRGLRVARRHRHLVLAQEQLIKDSSLTIENGAAETAVPPLTDMDFEDLAPAQIDALADVTELQDVESWDDLEPAAEENLIAAPAESVMDDEFAADEDIPEPSDELTPEPGDAAEPEADESDLDWLWRKLSDETK